MSAIVLAVLACSTSVVLVAVAGPRSRLLTAGLFAELAGLTFALAVRIATRPVPGPPWDLVVSWPVLIAGFFSPWLAVWLLAVALRRRGRMTPARLVLAVGGGLCALWLYATLVTPVESLTGRCLPPADDHGSGCDLPPG